jgi:ribulose-5-phosphate 4-epimerase/fuculose-1-phosphate aldolase
MAESNQGVKFKTIMRGEEVPQDDRLPELKRWCSLFHELGLAPEYPGGSYGNLSFRIHEGETAFIITGTCIGMKDCLSNDHFVEVTDCDPDQKTIFARGARQPSSESMMHFLIYEGRPEIQAVFHGHSTEILAAAARLGITETEQELPYGSKELAEAVNALAREHTFFIARNHGFISLGKCLEEAGTQCLDVLMRARQGS